MAAIASVRASPCRRRRRALHVRRQVGIADHEPGRRAVALEHRVRRERVAPDAPAAFGVDQAAERIEQRVDVGADVQPVELHVVADVGDDGQLDAIAQQLEAVRELGAASAAGEERDLHEARERGLDLPDEPLLRLGVVGWREAEDEVPEPDPQEGPQPLDDLVDRSDRLVLPQLRLAVSREHRLEHAPRLGGVVADDAGAGADRPLDLCLIAADLVTVPAKDLVLALDVLEAAAEVARVRVASNDPERLLLTPSANQDRQAILDRRRVIPDLAEPGNSALRTGARRGACRA